MNKTKFIESISNKTNISKNAASQALDAIVQIITESLSKGEEVALVGFGSFKQSERKERTGRNPQTGVEMKIPASKVVKFKAGKKLRDAVNDGDKK